MALVSPGVQVTVTDEAQYLPTALGSVPFVVIATEQDKTINGVTASATTKTNAGKIYGITSQRELTSLFGTPTFRRSSSDTPLHGDELNEYGLMAAYSALGLGNRVWVVRADIDLKQLVGSSIRPRGFVPNGTNWLDTGASAWGIHEFDSLAPQGVDSFVVKTPRIISDATETSGASSYVPLSSVGSSGEYAIVTLTNRNNLYYKTRATDTTSSEWVAVGSSAWVESIPVAVGERTSAQADLAGAGNIAIGSTLEINGNVVTIGSVCTSIEQFKSAINTVITTTVTTGALASITVSAQGSGYTIAPAVTFSGGGGAGAAATAVLGTGPDANKVVSVNITNAGTGYTSAPTVSIAAPVKTTGVVVADLSGGSITGFTVTTIGKGYLTAPTVTITGDGADAAATAVLGTGAQAGEIVSFTITNPGTGYTTATVTISAPAAGTQASGTAVLATAPASSVPGVRVVRNATTDRLEFYATSLSASNGITADGKIKLKDGVNSPLAKLGFFGLPPANPLNVLIAHTNVSNNIGVMWNWDTANLRWHQASFTFSPAAVVHGNNNQEPIWRREDYLRGATARPSGSIWMKTSSANNGASIKYKRYNSIANSWIELANPIYANAFDAIYNLDRSGGGLNIEPGSLFTMQVPLNNGIVGFKVFTQSIKGQTKVTGANSSMTLATGWAFTIKVSQLDGVAITRTCTIGTIGSGANANQRAFVQAILDQNIPNVSAVVESTGKVSILHRSGGIITMNNVGLNDTLGQVGFTSTTPGVLLHIGGTAGDINLTNWSDSSLYIQSATTPAANPEDGKLWYYNDPATVDIMINDDSGWKGYRTLTSDTRGFNLTLTDPLGVIVSASQPLTQQGGTPLESGDLWLDSGDLENYPRLYRYNKTTKVWSLLNTSDRLSQNGIVFADARWDTTGTIDPVTGTLPPVADMLTSNYIDQDAPDYRLYPRGMLLFNTRRSGFTVKRFTNNYFNSAAFPSLPTVPGADSVLPAQKSTWVSEIGFKTNGEPKMGHHAQRNEVVAGLKAAVDANTDLREEGYNYNLLSAPGYPELIPNLVALNRDRGQTGFVIGDVSMVLPNTVTQIISYESTELPTGDPYVAVYYPSALTNDLSGNEIAVPASHMMLRTFLYNDQVAYPWFAPAGTRRGLIDNASAIGYVDSDTGTFMRTGINNALRDTLYDKRINPITLLNGVGIVAYGQKTRNSAISNAGSSLDRVNVARLVNYLRTILTGVANQFIFEPNDKITRDQIKTSIEGLLNDLVAKRGVYDYLVVCDETNNTSDRIARNELYVDVAIEPMKAVEFIYIPIRLRNPGTISGSSLTSE